MAQTQMETRQDPVQQMARISRTYAPAVDIYETQDELVLLADVPGVRPEGVDVQFERGTLTINASVAPRRNDDEIAYMAREYGIGNYHRAFEINDDIDAERIEARIDDGVLCVRMPKSEAVKPRKIEVKS